MKRILPLLLAAVMVFSLAACGNQPSTPSTPAVDPTPEPTTPAESSEPTTPVTEGGKTLVVYYSATNHTEAVAQTIASHMGGDLFEIVPTQPYTDADLNWRDEDSRVCKEHDDPALQTIELETTTPDNWTDYDTVFIGYPIWWQNASWVVTSFVSANDFEGKTIIPFCTSSSSDLGESGDLLAELAGTGDWLEGQRFRSGVAEADVVEWVNGLSLK